MIGKLFAAIGVFSTAACLVALPMWLWKVVCVDLGDLPPITFWQVVSLYSPALLTLVPTEKKR